MPKLQNFEIPRELHGERFDVAAVKLTGISRKQIRRLIDSGRAFLNKKRVWIAKFQVTTGDLMELCLNECSPARSPLDIDLTPAMVVQETTDFLVLNKPAGIAVDSTRNNILTYLSRLDSTYCHLSLAHRLDKETSGLLILTKHAEAQAEFEKLFAKRQIRKLYWALCFDTPKSPTGRIILPIARYNTHQNRYMAVTNGSSHAQAKTARTDYRLLTSLDGGRISLLECQPHTGRPHQIRVHLQAIGHPVLGDKFYADHLSGHPHWQTAEHQMLHSYQLQFIFRNQHYTLTAPLPQDFQAILDRYR